MKICVGVATEIVLVVVSLERNIQKADYDLVINDYARAKALFGNTDVQVKLSKRIFDFVNLIH
jgi:hypothetical protein